MRRILLSGVLAATMFSAPAYAGSSVDVDVGNGTVVKLATGRPLKIAFFSEGTNNSAMTASIEGARAAARELGWTIDVFDGRFDSVNQANQIANALNRDYDAFIVKPLEGNVMCEPASIEAPKRNILTVVAVLPICGRSGKEGEEQWTPGTLSYIGGTQSPNAFLEVLNKVAQLAPGPQKVGILTGNNLNPITLNFDTALERFLANHPEWTVAAKARTDWSTPVAQAKAEVMVQANPDITLYFAHYSNMTRGIVAVLKEKGLMGKVKVFDAGGTAWAAHAVENGEIAFTTALYLASNARAAVYAIAAAQKGELVPHLIQNEGKPITTVTLVQFYDKSNIAQYHAEAD